MSSAIYHRSVSVRPAVYARLRKAAADRNVSISVLVERALEPYITSLLDCDCAVCAHAKKHPQLKAPRCWERES